MLARPAILGLVAALCNQPASAADPVMTPQQARAYLDAKEIDPVPDNYPEQIMNGDAKAVDALITLGIDVNAKTSLDQPPLEMAATSCAGGHVPTESVVHIMDSLIRAGADPNAPAVQGMSPLMIAAQQCTPSVVKRLLAAGADMNSRTPQGYTPLSMALVVKNYATAEALIGAGARISAEGGKKLTDGSKDTRLNDLVARATSQ